MKRPCTRHCGQPRYMSTCCPGWSPKWWVPCQLCWAGLFSCYRWHCNKQRRLWIPMAGETTLEIHLGCSPWGLKESDRTEWLHFHALEKEMATHSSVLAWRIPGTGEPGGLPSMGSHRVGHDWSDLAAAAIDFQVIFLLLFSHLVMSNSLWPYGLQHARLLHPSLSPGVCSNSCLLSWSCYPTFQVINL